MSRLTAKKNSRKIDELERTIENLRKDNRRLQEQLSTLQEKLSTTIMDLHYFQNVASLCSRKFNELYEKCLVNGESGLVDGVVRGE